MHLIQRWKQCYCEPRCEDAKIASEGWEMLSEYLDNSRLVFDVGLTEKSEKTDTGCRKFLT
jgi:hypothetical protein